MHPEDGFVNFKTQRVNEGNLPKYQERLSATESFRLTVINQRKRRQTRPPRLSRTAWTSDDVTGHEWKRLN